MGEPARIVTTEAELRAVIRRATQTAPMPLIADVIVRELSSGRDVEDVKITAEDRAVAARALKRRQAKGR